MITIPSAIESQEKEFDAIRRELLQHQFSLGGNWSYERGSFDRNLDGENKVWLRLPFEVIRGNIDSESTDNNCTIKFETPYVLKHLYQEGVDSEAASGVMSALVNQFQSPSDPDAKVEGHWADQAKRVLSEVEDSMGL